MDILLGNEFPTNPDEMVDPASYINNISKVSGASTASKLSKG